MAEGQVNPPGGWIPNAQNANRDNAEPAPELSAKQLRALNEQRQKQIVADTERLLHLAEELNRDLDGSNNLPADEEMRKVSQIEKLARSVKDKMREAVTAGPVVAIPQPPWRP
jgi:transposase